MKTIYNLSRRAFCKSAATIGGGLLLGFYIPGCSRKEESGLTPVPTFVPNAFVCVAPDETVTIIVNKSEMGQGVYTSLPMLVAEELAVDWNTITFEPAPVDPAYNHTQWGPVQGTGGSTSIRSCWEQFRKAGAAARLMLERAAADTWRVNAHSCNGKNGYVHHAPTNRKISYGKLVRNAANQKVPEIIPLKNPKNFTVIGSSRKRLDTVEKVNGKAIFGMDVRLPGMLTAVVARSPVYGGKIKKYDSTRARNIPGVREIVHIDSGMAVVADTFHAAVKGRRALEIDWNLGMLTTLDSDTQRTQYALLARQPGLAAVDRGDTKSALQNAAKVIDAVYDVPYLAHAPMEPLNCVANVMADSCEIWVGTQLQSIDRDAAAAVTGLPKDKVKLHTTYLGGGFGRRAVGDSHFVREAVQISKAVQQPVKIIWTREDDITGWYYRPRSYNVLQGGIDAQGRPIAIKHTIVNQSIAKGTVFEIGMVKDGIDNTSVEGAYDSPYAVDNHLVEYHMAPAGIPVLWWRSVGHSFTAFVKEGFIDELAHLAGQDPYTYRRQLLAAHPRQQALLDLVAEQSNWGKNGKDHFQGMAIHESFGSIVAQVAEVTVADSGRIKVHRVVCGVDCGQAVNPDTIKAQMESGIVFGLTAALYGEITLKNGHVQQSNFHDYEMLRIDACPEIEVHIVAGGSEPGGIGEPGVPPIAPAVANAVYAATGVRFRQLPMNTKRVRSALQQS